MVEVVVASSAFLVVMMIGAGALKVVKRTGDHLKARGQPRQQLRTLLGHLQRDVRAATFVYDPHVTAHFGGGYSHVFNGAPPSKPEDPAKNEVVFALTDSAATEPSYTVVALFLKPDSEEPFPGAQRVVMARTPGQVGPTPGSPADIPLGALPPGATEVRSFATASPTDGLRVRLSPSSDGLWFEFVIGHRSEGEAVLYETYQTQLTLRNNR
jgi:hypothetical protein